MKVICAGMSKTGTKSLHAALEKLGYSVHDYFDAFDNFETEYAKFHDQGWTVSDFRRMYENIDAVEGGPAFYFWEELAKAFPEAKVVLTIRDDDTSWFKSLQNHISKYGSLYFYYYPFLSPSWRRFWKYMFNSVSMCRGLESATGFETYVKPNIEILSKQVYRRHITHVLNKCSQERLLVFKCKDGWKPLCEFLGKTVPDEPFPRVNVKGKLANSIWQTNILKQATKEVRIKGCIIASVITLTGYFIVKRFILR